MDPRKLHSECGLDRRLTTTACVYCGGPPETVDHVPSKVLLDDPLPADLPVVPACRICNREYSADEEYLACFLECVLVGTTDPERVRRPKIQRALRHSKKLAEKIGASMRAAPDGQMVWSPEISRIEHVALKLARGHALYELSSYHLEAPESVACVPLVALTIDAQRTFEGAAASNPQPWPEIGSRAFLRAIGARPFTNRPGPWVEVQPGQYRYSVEGDALVRIVLAEYLACAVEWA